MMTGTEVWVLLILQESKFKRAEDNESTVLLSLYQSCFSITWTVQERLTEETNGVIFYPLQWRNCKNPVQTLFLKHMKGQEWKINNTQTNPKYHYTSWLCNFCGKTFQSVWTREIWARFYVLTNPVHLLG